jgi:hypothetical protein
MNQRKIPAIKPGMHCSSFSAVSSKSSISSKVEFRIAQIFGEYDHPERLFFRQISNFGQGRTTHPAVNTGCQWTIKAAVQPTAGAISQFAMD